MKPVVRRERADIDARAAIDFYREQDAPEAALRLVAALDDIYGKIGRHPSAGSPRYGWEMGAPGLRFRKVPNFPFLVFYFELEDRAEIIRVLHAKRDMPKSLGDAL